MKDQFQSSETLRIRLTPFVSKTTGDYVITGLDTCTLTIKKPDGSLLSGGPHLATWDTDVHMWIFDVLVANYMQGEWRVKAVSNDADSLSKWANYTWGDYVDDFTTIKNKTNNLPATPADEATVTSVNTNVSSVNTKLGTPAGASVSADIASVQTKLGTPAGASVSADVASVQSKLGTPAGASVSADIASVQTKLGTPVGASVSADIASVQTAASAAQSSSAIASSNTTDMRKIQLNRWKVDNNQLIVYENDQSTVYKVFDLLDEYQNPSSLRIYERVPV